jgi:ribose/xylose/arabinose/galactoside ABC-type transport system permease subunit
MSSPERSGAGRRVLAVGAENLTQLAAPILVLTTFAVATLALPSLFAGSTLYSLAIQTSVLGLVALGQMLTMLVRGVDLSVNAVMALGAVLVVETGTGTPVVVGVIASVCLALVVGLVNGLLVTKRRVPPFVATLGMLIFIGGARLAYTKGQASGLVPNFLRLTATTGVAFVPWDVVICVIAGCAVAVLMYRTVLGRWVYATGSNYEAARASGVPVERVIVLMYVLSSLLALLAGLLLSGYLNYVDQNLANGYNLESITAAVVGGTAFVGGRGAPLGVLAGALLVTLAGAVVIVAGLPVQLQYVAEGVVLAGALTLQTVAPQISGRLVENT